MATVRERREARALAIVKAIGRPARKPKRKRPRIESPRRGKGVAVEWIRQHVTYEADTCLIFPFYRAPDGYGRVGFLNKSYYPHQMMCQFAHGPKPGDGYEVAHSCGNGVGGCTNPRHLSWKTKSDNRRDSNLHGTGVRNLRGNRGKLTPDQVMEIRGLKGRKSQHEIAAMFGISAPSVRAIFTGKMYASVS